MADLRGGYRMLRIPIRGYEAQAVKCSTLRIDVTNPYKGL